MKVYLKNLNEKIKESSISVVPFFVIIMALYLIFLPFNVWAFLGVILATIFMIFGMALFNIGVDMSTMKMGGYVGSHLSKSRKFTFMIVLSFILGFIVTIAEPDLMVLAEQVPGISSEWIILITVSCGTGVFLILSTIRTLFRLSIRTMLMISYMLALILCIFAPVNFLPLAFDTIGVTTGAVSVPFIMAFGLGICAVRSGKQNQDDGFGLIALASIGPVIAILIAYFMQLDTVFFIGLVLIACCPGGSSSNIFSYIAKGDVALSVSMTAVSSIVTLVTLPIIMSVCVSILNTSGVESEFGTVQLPVGKLLLQNVVLMLIPIILGVLTQLYFKNTASLPQHSYA